MKKQVLLIIILFITLIAVGFLLGKAAYYSISSSEDIDYAESNSDSANVPRLVGSPALPAIVGGEASSSNNGGGMLLGQIEEVSVEIADVEASPILEAAVSVRVNSPTGDNEVVDLFVTREYGMVAGRDSKTDELVTNSYLDYFESGSIWSGDLIKQVVVPGLDVLSDLNRGITVQVIGLMEGAYTLTGTFRDQTGEVQQFSFATTTAKAMQDVYDFDYKSGEITVRRLSHVFTGLVLAGDSVTATECDVEGLTGQLTELLTENGWMEEKVPLIDTKVSVLSEIQNRGQEYPFGYQKVCAVTMTFREKFENTDLLYSNNVDILYRGFEYTNEPVVVAGQNFYQMPADGSTATSNTIPLTYTGKELQFI
ncbi:hypothetical protein KC921_04720, partial [Candidatus Woesebacteria bacterium]|nr:hypothetical protein [Candidatus Woesebacteria bacterium]